MPKSSSTNPSRPPPDPDQWLDANFGPPPHRDVHRGGTLPVVPMRRNSLSATSPAPRQRPGLKPAPETQEPAEMRPAKRMRVEAPASEVSRGQQRTPARSDDVQPPIVLGKRSHETGASNLDPPAKRPAHGEPTREQLDLNMCDLAEGLGRTLLEEVRHQVEMLESRTVRRQDLLRMSRDNPLAHVNGHGRALAFLTSAKHPAANISMLNRFLGHANQLLLDERLSRDDRKSLEQDLDLAAHYVLKLDWLHGADNWKQWAHLANRFSQHAARPACLAAIGKIAGVFDERAMRAMRIKDAALLANACAKDPEDPLCQRAAELIATRVQDDASFMASMGETDAAMLLMALSKWPKSDRCAAVTRQIAMHMARDTGLAQRDDNTIVCALHALSMLEHHPDGNAAASLLAGQLSTDALGPRDAGRMIKALACWPQIPACAQAHVRLRDRIIGDGELAAKMDPTALTMVLLAASKQPDDPGNRAVARLVAQRRLPLPERLDASLVHADLDCLCNWPDVPECMATVRALLARLAAEPALADALNAKGVARSLKAMVTFALDDDMSKKVARVLARRILDEDAIAQGARPATRCTMLGALSQRVDDPCCREAMLALAEPLASDTQPWATFETKHLGVVANALASLSSNLQGDDPQRREAIEDRAVSLARHLDTQRHRIDSATAQDLGTILKALAQLGLHREMRPLVKPALARLDALLADGALHDPTDLETLGNLCMGLLPCLRNEALKRKLRRPVLAFLERLHPVLAGKIHTLLNPEPGEVTDTRRPGVSVYQVLKAYHVVAGQWKTKNVEAPVEQVETRQQDLARWVSQTLDASREMIRAELDDKADNVIGLIDAGDRVLDAVDLRLVREADRISTQSQPTRLDLKARRDSMAGKPHAVDALTGATRRRVVDPRGRELHREDDGELPYSLYTRLTGQPQVEVQLPDSFGAFLLTRTFKYEGDDWRFDLAWGSHLTKGKKRRAADILSGAPKGHGRLPAIRLRDSMPDSDMVRLLGKLAPQREDAGRLQRSLFETVPHDHVLERPLKTGWLKDVPGPGHEFKLEGHGRQIALCPDDGLGFLKWEVAMEIPAVRELIEAWEIVRDHDDPRAKPGGAARKPTQAQRELIARLQPKPVKIASQALQHFPLDPEVVEESRTKLKQKLRQLAQGESDHPAPESVDKLTLYQLTVNGGYEGVCVRAVPSADDKLHLPALMSAEFDAHGGTVLLGKAPFDKENLLPIPAEKVGTVANGDDTAKFLGECFTVQYSLTGFDDDSKDLDMVTAKGMLLVPPPGYWSEAHAHLDAVFSTSDMKTHSRWIEGRDRESLSPNLQTTCSLRIKKIDLPGFTAAIAKDDLRKREMDCDGDYGMLYANAPALAAHITKVMDNRNARRGNMKSFKPKKTATSAFDAQGRYQTGRAQDILSARRGDAVVGRSSSGATSYLSQPEHIAMAMAEQMHFGLYDGIERALKRELREQLKLQEPDLGKLAELELQAENAIGFAHVPVAVEVATCLAEQIECWRTKSAAKPAPLSNELTRRFAGLAQAWKDATTPRQRVQAIVDNYPALRLSNEKFPEGQPGYIENEPELSVRDVFTVSIKSGTDAGKSNVDLDLAEDILRSYEAAAREKPDRVRDIPHTKSTAYQIRDDRFDPERAKRSLERIPTLAGGVMLSNIEVLQEAGLLPKADPRAAKASAPTTPAMLESAARDIAARAQRNEPAITRALQAVVSGAGATLEGLDAHLKSKETIAEQLEIMMKRKGMTLQEATAAFNEALRFSVVIDENAFVSGYRRIMAALDTQRHEKTAVVNHFTRRPRHFAGLRVAMRAPSGQPYDIQFHTPQTLALKDEFHDVFKALQKQELQGVSYEKRQQWAQPATEAFRKVPLPPGVEDIEDCEDRAAPRPIRAGIVPQPRVQSYAKQVGELRQRAQDMEPAVTAVLRPLVEQAQGRMAGREQWRKHIFKSEKSLARKIGLIQRQQHLDADSAARRVRDALRYVVVLDDDTFGPKAQSVIDGLGREPGTTVVRQHNGFTQQASTYAGLNLQLRNADGEYEVQLHTPASLKAKYRGYKDYEKLRKLPTPEEAREHDEEGGEVFLDERSVLEEKMRMAAADVPKPAGIDAIVSFDRTRDDAPGPHRTTTR